MGEYFNHLKEHYNRAVTKFYKNPDMLKARPEFIQYIKDELNEMNAPQSKGEIDTLLGMKVIQTVHLPKGVLWMMYHEDKWLKSSKWRPE